MAFNQQGPYVAYGPAPPPMNPYPDPSGYPMAGPGMGMGMGGGGYPQMGMGGGYPMQGGFPPMGAGGGGVPMMGQPGMGGMGMGGMGGMGFNPQSAAASAAYMHHGFPKEGGGGEGGVGVGAGDGDGAQYGMEFSDKTIRRAFIRKVYSILMLQLLATVCLIGLFIFNDDVKFWAYRHSWLIYVAMGAMIGLLLVLTCCTSVRRQSPQNFICLGLFTLIEGFLLGVISSVHGRDEVFLAGGITVFICLALTLFSFQTKWDFTAMGGILFVAVLILMLFGILSMFFPVLKIFYACAGAFIFCCYLVYDTQLMLGGKHKNAISPEEYIFAALSLYLDIINIFMYILAILSSSRGDN